MASRSLSRVSSMVAPQVTSPGNTGQVTTSPPSAFGWNTKVQGRSIRPLTKRLGECRLLEHPRAELRRVGVRPEHPEELAADPEFVGGEIGRSRRTARELTGID